MRLPWSIQTAKQVMARIKPLLPTLRERKRYLAFEVLSEKELQWAMIKKAVFDAMKEYVGVNGISDAGLLFVKNNGNKGILRVSHTSLNKVRAALIFIKNIDSQKVIVKSIGASGMLNKANDYIA
ncbi:ribonuclease P [Candidatus Woesearchaeota archaeon]|nr:ribonuclease P [Candidatus Woesearchaeota archaeon]